MCEYLDLVQLYGEIMCKFSLCFAAFHYVLGVCQTIITRIISYNAELLDYLRKNRRQPNDKNF